MSRWLVPVLAVFLAVTAQECDFDLGELNQYVVTYDLRVTNSSPTSLAVVTVKMKGTSRSATLAKGRTLAVTGFAGGDYTITVGHIGLRLKQLEQRRQLALMFIDSWKIMNDPVKVAEYQAQVQGLTEAIKVIDAGTSGATCKGKIKADKSVTVVVSEQAGKWSC